MVKIHKMICIFKSISYIAQARQITSM